MYVPAGVGCRRQSVGTLEHNNCLKRCLQVPTGCKPCVRGYLPAPLSRSEWPLSCFANSSCVVVGTRPGLPYVDSTTVTVQKRLKRGPGPRARAQTPNYKSKTPNCKSKTPNYKSKTPNYKSKTPKYKSKPPVTRVAPNEQSSTQH